ncbi:creatininase family protein [Nocardia brasiliensis]|uniref:creatininase family protein n=1 Tax=Nocardia brasiliensis TaxID=37326 RepID=UPI0032AEE6C6
MRASHTRITRPTTGYPARTTFVRGLPSEPTSTPRRKTNVLPLLTTATSATEAARHARIAVVPIGSFEQHGAHLPLTTDTIIACSIGQRIADAYRILLLPPVTISCSHEHEGFAGTVSVSATTLTAIVQDITASLARAGVLKIVLVNGHGGNHVLSNVVLEQNASARRMTLFPAREDWAMARAHAEITTNGHDDMHGGELETSMLLHLCPELVSDCYTSADHDANDRPYLLISGIAGYTKTGIIGRPACATAVKGRAVLESLVRSFGNHLKILNELG